MKKIAPLLVPSEKLFSDVSLNDEQKEILYGIFEEIVELKILDAVISVLSEDDQVEFAQLVNQPAEPETIENFLRKYIPDLDNKLQAVLTEAEQEIRTEVLQHIR